MGVGLRPTHYDVFLTKIPSSVFWVEVISENFMSWLPHSSQTPLPILTKVREQIPVKLHGVSMSIGSVDPINREHLQALKTLVDCIEPSTVSDHLCWTGVDEVNLHDLLPLPYTYEALNHVAQKIDQVQNALKRPLMIENVSSYLSFKSSEMTEWEFLCELTRKTNCQLLVDINNIYVSSVNHRFDPMDYIRALPTSAIAQVHLAGHRKKEGYLIDTHDEPVCDEVWDLFTKFTRIHGLKSTMIERDDQIPSWSELEKELLKIHDVRKAYRAHA